MALENGSALANGHHAQPGDTKRIAATNSNQDSYAEHIRREEQIVKTDPQLQAARFDMEASQRISSAGTTSIEIVAAMFEEYAQRIAFGYCPAHKAHFVTLTYAQVWERIKALAAAWQTGGMVQSGEFVGICGFASVDWAVSDMACLYTGAVTVPLPTNILAEDIREIIKEAECAALVVSLREVPGLSPIIANCPTVRHVIIMDSSADEVSASGAVAEMRANLPAGCQLTSMEKLLAYSDPSAARMVIPGRDGWVADPLVNLMYTSGSSGRPKGAEYRESLYVQFLKLPVPGDRTVRPSIMLGFLPLNHLMGRMSLLKGMLAGGQTHFTRAPDMTTFFEDLALVRPTEGLFPPRITSMLYDRFQEELARLPPADTAEGREQQRQDLIRRFRHEVLGGRLFSASTGSAPSAPDVLQWLKEVMGFPIINAYGSTEGGMITINNKMTEEVLAYKLVDCPDLGYTTADKPYPRGELRLKTKRMIPGYFKRPESHADLFDSDGYLMTGDVMEQTAEDTFVWIDRVKNIIKLSQGEFVSVSRLEQIYAAGSSAIHQIYIYGSSLRAYLVAVVVPAVEPGQQADAAKLKAKLRTEIDNVARHKKLQGYEIPREFIIDFQPFSKANHLITDSNKMARGQLKKRYAPELEALYAALEERQQERLRTMRAGGNTSVPERIRQAVEVTLGLADEDVAGAEGRSFAQLGGDSLAAIQFARLVGELCGVNLPVSFVLDHSHSLGAITARVHELISGEGPAGITCESIHGSHPRVIKAADLKLERFLSAEDIAAAAAAAPAAQLPREPEVVLLTGANGFLGRFLLLDLLQRVASKPHGRVVAIVRAGSDEEAARRLRSSFDSGDADLLRTYDALSAEHLTVFTGDLAKPQLGLSDGVWRQLAADVDTILHNGALVNHAFSYEQLFEPNVLGSVEVMRLALTLRKKALAYVSTVGVVGGLDHPQPVLESEDGPSLCSEHPGDNGYAMGYGCSKWAVEVLLRQLHDQHGIPVSIFRCGMILAHTRYLGQINPTDFFTRLLCGINYTGFAPRSFYVQQHIGEGAHFNGMPVDFVAGVIAATAAVERANIGTYHVVNPHYDDGISLDTIVDWVQSAGYLARRVEDYAQWYSNFKGALEGLDVKRQQQSPLPIIYQWAKPSPAQDGTKFDATQLRTKARELTQWGDVPHLDEAFIHKNMAHLAALRLIAPASQAS